VVGFCRSTAMRFAFCDRSYRRLDHAVSGRVYQEVEMAECGSITLSGYIFSLKFEHIEPGERTIISRPRDLQ
jgi:hypothetical protein